MIFLIHCLLFVGVLSASSKHPRSLEREEDGAFIPRKHGEDDDHSFDHEAILGSSKEANAFQNLSPEEAKSRLAILLKKMDRNGNSKIEDTELHSWILRSFKSLSLEESNERLSDADEDNDGFVTWAEYLEEEFGSSDFENEDEEMDAEELALMREDKYLFTAADKDNDGRLSSQEFLSFTHPEEDPTMATHVIKQILDERDTNFDGKLDFQEYIGSRGKDLDKDRLKEEKDRFDDELDDDANGYMDRDEISNWIIPSNEEIAEEETEHLLAGSDDDHDGVLTFEEILNHHDLFVGSEATDYGSHLQNIHKFEDEL
uniref:Reticulocalbin-3 n=1 Tax=Caligus clemensi TaxID=344056 RepID=C1C076_CALCM|nr:Calumenin precursor [Caligus clemensi]